MRLTFQHNLADIMELNCSAREQRIKGWLVILMGVAMIFVGIGVWIFPNNQSEATPGTFYPWAIVLIVIGLLETRIAGLGGWFLKSKRTPYEIEVSQDGLEYLESGQRVVALGWKAFSRWFETKNLLVLVVPGEAMAIPKRSAGEAEWMEFVALVRSKLGSPARW